MNDMVMTIDGGRASAAAKRLAGLFDRAITAIVAVTVTGSIVAFGGRVWWAPLALTVCCGLLAVATVASWLCRGAGSIVRGPWNLAWLFILGIMIVQIVPLGLLRNVGPRSPAALERLLVNASGAVRDEPVDPSLGAETIVSADRSATLRCAAQGLALFVLFLVVGGHVNRASRLSIVWNSAILGFGITTVFAALQLVADAPGAFGLWIPGQGPAWAPNDADLIGGTVPYQLRAVAATHRGGFAWLERHPEVPFAIGPLVEGAGAYLTLSALVLPLLAGTILHRLAPRGSTERLAQRLRGSGGLPGLYLLCGIAALAAFLSGYLGGALLASVIAVLIVATCLLSGRRGGIFRAACVMALVGAMLCASGTLVGRAVGRPAGVPWLASESRSSLVRGLWNNSVLLLRSFPMLGVGAGGFDAVEPYIKQSTANSPTAQSSVLQWGAELGSAGIVVALAAIGWALYRLPGAWRAVGAADQPLVAGLIGAAAGCLALSCFHTTIQYPAAAVCGTAIVACLHRWLCGATDLFVEEPSLV